MNEIPDVETPELIKGVEYALTSMEAEPFEFETPTIISTAFIINSESRRELIQFYEFDISKRFKIFGGKFGLETRTSDRIAMGPKSSFYSFCLFHFGEKVNLEIIHITYLKIEDNGLRRSIYIDTTDRPRISFSSLHEARSVLEAAVQFTEAVRKAMEG